MKTIVTLQTFREAFRAIRPDSFSHEGLEILFDYLEEYEDSCGTEIEFDVIGLCCDYSEEHWTDIAENYDIDLSDCEDDDEKLEAVEEWLQDTTRHCGTTSEGNIVYCSSF